MLKPFANSVMKQEIKGIKIMAMLMTPKNEKFCQAYIKYECNEETSSDDWKKMMEEAGYAKNRQNFLRLMGDPKIRGRILEFQKAAANKEILNLEERLKMLTVLAKDEKNSPSQRISALNSIHKQSGDDIISVTKESSAKGTNVVRMVDLKLPDKENQDAKREAEAAQVVGFKGKKGEKPDAFEEELNKFDVDSKKCDPFID